MGRGHVTLDRQKLLGCINCDIFAQLSGFIGSSDPERDRRRALVDLQTDVAGPLLDQTDLFTALAADGIQQPNRPQRELDRLRSLNAQGATIANELKRLELAWHSLATDTDWRDLSRLDDRMHYSGLLGRPGSP